MKAQRALEHRLWAQLKLDGLRRSRVLVACSGGADSVALVRAFATVRPASELVIAHIHHGTGANEKHRENATEFTEEFAKKLKLNFKFRRFQGEELRSEADFRRERRRLLQEIQLEVGAAYIVTGHHAQDLLETRLLALIRGAAGEGLRALRTLRPPWYRPFLGVDVADLRSYLAELGQEWCDDPTNNEARYFRNWLRQEWLPALETRRPGSTTALARSLQNCVEELAAARAKQPKAGPFLSRPEWEGLTLAEQRRELAHYLRARGVPEFTRGQLEEVCRRLDSSRKEHTFVVAGCFWQVNAEQIRADRSDKVL